MIPQKKKPKKQLEKYSTLFLQISLVLVLFITYVLMENVIGVKVTTPERALDDSDLFLFPSEPQNFIKESPKKKLAVVKVVPKIINLTKIKIGNPPKIVSLIIKPTTTIVPVQTSSGKNNGGSTTKEVPVIEKQVYNFSMVTPLFKGCKSLSNEENRACFEKKMKRFVQRKFDAGLAEVLGLSSGDYKIYAQFIINEKGEVVDIKVRAPHIRLQKNVQKMIGKLPQFIPGEVAGKKVKVRYLLPIKFQVD
ncbi:MAG: energy transducer TonB [Flavobacteriaceae bacterium]|nr:energy transducer TonB [Flavobacteriaceae bacterium]